MNKLVTLLFLFSLPLIAATEPRSKTVGGFFENKSKFKNLSQLRDPFRAPIKKLKKKKTGKSSFVRNGIFTNIPGINNVPLDEIQIIGVMVGKNRTALAKVKGNPHTIILKEGMKLGANKAELKAILPGGIVLVEKITNIYGQQEYLETVMPINKD